MIEKQESYFLKLIRLQTYYIDNNINETQIVLSNLRTYFDSEVKADSCNKSDRAYLFLARSYIYAGDLIEARKLYDKALELFPDSNLISQELNLLNQTDEADIKDNKRLHIIYKNINNMEHHW